MTTNYYPYRCREDAVEEYKSLRSEIIESQKQRVSLLQYSLVFIGVLFGYLYKDFKLESTEALLLIVLSIPCALFSYATRCRERRIAKYIAVFLPELSPWSVLSASMPRLEFTQRTSTSIVLTMVLLNALTLFVSFPEKWTGGRPLECVYWIVCVATTFANVAILRAVTRLPDYESRMHEILIQMKSRAESERAAAADG